MILAPPGDPKYPQEARQFHSPRLPWPSPHREEKAKRRVLTISPEVPPLLWMAKPDVTETNLLLLT